ncbi:hypothetical protein FIA58_017205 [Flavobacterium jejuense]|uniref:Uncharacterized protein n=1 Tax=Flavobacterium jejuense TaxID=1544455 RepID=A0ABX0J0D7_9FLAO|nr:hypothetical protein [Flavobacterium jejuense]NHN27420.1 hypothetical protein [Flavobacterium jejuense]
MDKHKILSLKIEDDRVGDFVLGMCFDSFENKFLKPDYFYYDKFLTVNSVFPSKTKYVFFDSICCWFDVKFGNLERIDLYNDFSGVYKKTVSLNKKLSCIKQLKIELKYDEDCVELINDWKLYIVVDEDLTILNSIEDIYNTKIEMITLKL